MVNVFGKKTGWVLVPLLLMVGCAESPPDPRFRPRPPVVYLPPPPPNPPITPARKSEVSSANRSQDILFPVPPSRPVQPERQLADGSQIPAVRGLLANADQAVAKGDLEAALNHLERAQRLAPQSVDVYQKMADIRFQQGKPAEAEQLARKAVGLTTSPSRQAQLWRLVAKASLQQGKVEAAQEARTRASQLEGVPAE